MTRPPVRSRAARVFTVAFASPVLLPSLSRSLPCPAPFPVPLPSLPFLIQTVYEMSSARWFMYRLGLALAVGGEVGENSAWLCLGLFGYVLERLVVVGDSLEKKGETTRMRD